MPSSTRSNADSAGDSPPSRRDDGFALIVVIWIMALLALSASLLASATTGYLDIARNDLEWTRATLVADAGIQLAMQELLMPTAARSERRFAAGAPEHTCRMPGGEVVTIRVDDEAGKVDLNVASDELLRALLKGSGVADDVKLDALVDAIADYRDTDDDRRPNGAEASEYAAAGRATGPKNAAFDAVVEFGSVFGVTSDLFQRLAPFLTVHSGQSGIDPRFARPALLKLLAPTPGTARIALPASGGSQDADVSIPAAFVVSSAARSFAIEAIAMTPSGTISTRRAIVLRVDGASRALQPQPGDEPLAENSSRPRPRQGRSANDQPALRVKEWGRGSARELAAPSSANSPQC